jgi:hypothetical protein
MATTTETSGPAVKEIDGTGAAGTGVGVGSHSHGHGHGHGHGHRDTIEKDTPLTHTATNISLSPELFEKVGQTPVSVSWLRNPAQIKERARGIPHCSQDSALPRI